MYKQIFQIFAFFFVINQLSAQLPRRWYVGLSLQVQKYWLYNYNDFNNPWLTPVAPKTLTPNAISGGLTFGCNFNQRFSFQTELQYSSQTQKFFYEYPNSRPRFDVICKLNYFKIPIIFQYNHLKWAKKTAGFYVEVGLQTSILSYYKQSITSVVGDDPSNQLIFEPNYISQTTPYPSNNTIIRPLSFSLFKTIQFGAIAGFGFKKIINEEYLLQAGLRFDYDLTNTDDYTFGAIGFDSELRVTRTYYPNPPKRRTSHNIRAGLNFSITYFLNN